MRSKRVGEAGRAIADYGETAAFRRAITCKCRNDCVSAQSDTLRKPLDVSDLILGINKKMEDCAIVPDVIGPRGLPQATKTSMKYGSMWTTRGGIRPIAINGLEPRWTTVLQEGRKRSMVLSAALNRWPYFSENL